MSESDGSSGPPPQCNFIQAYGDGPCYAAVIQYGDNGGPDLVPELMANAGSAQFVWQATKVVNFAGSASIQFQVNAGGGATLTASKLAQNATATDNQTTHQYITRVEIGVAVIAVPKRRMAWSGLAIKFYRNGQLRETIPLDSQCNPVADTNTPSGGPAFQAVRHFPAASDNDAVTITGIIYLQGNRGDPNFEFSPSDFSAKILVFATNCASS